MLIVKSKIKKPDPDLDFMGVNRAQRGCSDGTFHASRLPLSQQHAQAQTLFSVALSGLNMVRL